MLQPSLRSACERQGDSKVSTWHACQVVIQFKHDKKVVLVLKMLSKKENVINLISICLKCHIWMLAQLPTVTSIRTT